MILCGNNDDPVLDFRSFRLFDNFVILARLVIQMITGSLQLVNQDFSLISTVILTLTFFVLPWLC